MVFPTLSFAVTFPATQFLKYVKVLVRESETDTRTYVLRLSQNPEPNTAPYLFIYDGSIFLTTPFVPAVRDPGQESKIHSMIEEIGVPRTSEDRRLQRRSDELSKIKQVMLPALSILFRTNGNTDIEVYTMNWDALDPNFPAEVLYPQIDRSMVLQRRVHHAAFAKHLVPVSGNIEPLPEQELEPGLFYIPIMQEWRALPLRKRILYTIGGVSVAAAICALIVASAHGP